MKSCSTRSELGVLMHNLGNIVAGSRDIEVRGIAFLCTVTCLRSSDAVQDLRQLIGRNALEIVVIHKIGHVCDVRRLSRNASLAAGIESTF
jgi:hypothetical protein